MLWKIAHNAAIDLSGAAILMGILNITPDSFSDAGSYMNLTNALTQAKTMRSEGAAIIDIGGESTRPGAVPISPEQEQARILPVLTKLAQVTDMLLSIDTYNSSTAKASLELGAHIINDVYGLQKDPLMAEIVASFQAGIVIMHTNRGRIGHSDVIEDQKFFFDESLKIATKAGIKSEAIVLDPGFGFDKDFNHNLQLFKRINELADLGFPLLAATSRKKFLRTLSDATCSQDADVATSASSVLLMAQGCSIFRVHNIAINSQALAVASAMKTGHNIHVS